MQLLLFVIKQCMEKVKIANNYETIQILSTKIY